MSRIGEPFKVNPSESSTAPSNSSFLSTYKNLTVILDEISWATDPKKAGKNVFTKDNFSLSPRKELIESWRKDLTANINELAGMVQKGDIVNTNLLQSLRQLAQEGDFTKFTQNGECYFWLDKGFGQLTPAASRGSASEYDKNKWDQWTTAVEILDKPKPFSPPSPPKSPEQPPSIPVAPVPPEQPPSVPVSPVPPEQPPSVPVSPVPPEQPPSIPVAPVPPEQPPSIPVAPVPPEQPTTPTVSPTSVTPTERKDLQENLKSLLDLDDLKSKCEKLNMIGYLEDTDEMYQKASEVRARLTMLLLLLAPEKFTMEVTKSYLFESGSTVTLIMFNQREMTWERESEFDREAFKNLPDWLKGISDLRTKLQKDNLVQDLVNAALDLFNTANTFREDGFFNYVDLDVNARMAALTKAFNALNPE